MKYVADNHTFVICAYKESPYLEDCVQSILKQKYLGKIIMTTYTNNDHIRKVANNFNIPLYINKNKGTCIEDSFNFGAEQVDTELFTLVHQDDIYLENYLENALYYLNKVDSPIIYFSNYFELRDEQVLKKNLLLQIKRLMLFPFRSIFLSKKKWIRRLVLSFGFPICCPTICFVKKKMDSPLFSKSEIIFSIDYELCEILSKKKGSFSYGKEGSLLHRIHKHSGTSISISDTTRQKEELLILRKFWPKSIAGFIAKIYKNAQKSN